MTTVPPLASFEPSASRFRDGWIVLAASAAAVGVAALLIRRPKPACQPIGVPA
jgi:hypothetical protein